jgi:hypothetical protein
MKYVIVRDIEAEYWWSPQLYTVVRKEKKDA